MRKTLAQLILHRLFDHFITLCIVTNSLVLASRDYSGNKYRDFHDDWNDKIEIIDLALTIVYIFECVAKVFVMGFV